MSAAVELGTPTLGTWTKATFLGWVLGFVLILVLITLTGAMGLGDFQFGVGLGMGLGVGLMQSRRLTDSLKLRRGWILATAGGAATPFVIADLVGLIGVDLPWSLPLAVVGAGLVSGLLQARILHRGGRAVGWWMAASLLGWSLAAGTVVFNDRVLPRIPGIPGALLFIAVILLGGVLLGLVQGSVLGVTQRDRP